MVVSEIGEQWSPQTAPARQAEIHIITMDGISPDEPTSASCLLKTLVTMGMRIPKVPHDVPVANESPIATAKRSTGSRSFTAVALSTIPDTKGPASRKLVIVLRVHANVSIRIAGTICLKPAGIASIHSLNVRTFRQR